MATVMGLVGLVRPGMVLSLQWFESDICRQFFSDGNTEGLKNMRAGRTAVFGFQGRICFTCPALSV